jgi:hypothetical protein
MNGIKFAPVNKTMKFRVLWKVVIDYMSDYKLLKKDFDAWNYFREQRAMFT